MDEERGYIVGPDWYIDLPILWPHIGQLQMYGYQRICYPICTDIKTGFKAWKKCDSKLFYYVVGPAEGDMLFNN